MSSTEPAAQGATQSPRTGSPPDLALPPPAAAIPPAALPPAATSAADQPAPAPAVAAPAAAAPAAAAPAAAAPAAAPAPAASANPPPPAADAAQQQLQQQQAGAASAATPAPAQAPAAAVIVTPPSPLQSPSNASASAGPKPPKKQIKFGNSEFAIEGSYNPSMKIYKIVAHSASDGMDMLLSVEEALAILNCRPGKKWEAETPESVIGELVDRAGVLPMKDNKFQLVLVGLTYNAAPPVIASPRLAARAQSSAKSRDPNAFKDSVIAHPTSGQLFLGSRMIDGREYTISISQPVAGSNYSVVIIPNDIPEEYTLQVSPEEAATILETDEKMSPQEVAQVISDEVVILSVDAKPVVGLSGPVWDKFSEMTEEEHMKSAQATYTPLVIVDDASGVTVTQMDLDENEMNFILQKGHRFKVYKPNGLVLSKIFFCDGLNTDEGVLFWCDLGPLVKSSKDFLLLRHIENVQEGKQTENLKSGAAKSVPSDLCLSITSPDGVFELRAETTRDRQVWAHSLRLLSKKFKQLAEKRGDVAVGDRSGDSLAEFERLRVLQEQNLSPALREQRQKKIAQFQARVPENKRLITKKVYCSQTELQVMIYKEGELFVIDALDAAKGETYILKVLPAEVFIALSNVDAIVHNRPDAEVANMLLNQLSLNSFDGDKPELCLQFYFVDDDHVPAAPSDSRMVIDSVTTHAKKIQTMAESKLGFESEQDEFFKIAHFEEEARNEYESAQQKYVHLRKDMYSILENGSEFTMLHKNSWYRPSKRLLFRSDSKLCWARPKDGMNKNAKDFFEIKDISIRNGKETDTFKQSYAKDVNFNCCFSLISSNGNSLDLICEDVERKNAWLAALQYAIDDSRGQIRAPKLSDYITEEKAREIELMRKKKAEKAQNANLMKEKQRRDEEQNRVLKEKKKMLQRALELLRDGSVFLKHNPKGSKYPDRLVTTKTIFVENDRLYWCKAGLRDTSDVSHSMNLDEITAVHSGKHTESFKEDRSTYDNVCFSVVSDVRTLDLEAIDQTQRDLWVSSLKMACNLSDAPEEKKADDPAAADAAAAAAAATAQNAAAPADGAAPAAAGAAPADGAAAANLDTGLNATLDADAPKPADGAAPAAAAAAAAATAVAAATADGKTDAAAADASSPEEIARKAEAEAKRAEKKKLKQDFDEYERKKKEYNLMRYLIDGRVLTKFCTPNKWGMFTAAPRHKFFWLNDEMICYVDPKYQNKPNADQKTYYLSLSSITEVAKGKTTPSFEQKYAQDVSEDLCFSVVSPTRTLDIQCSSKNERDLWVEGLMLAISKSRAGVKITLLQAPALPTETKALIEKKADGKGAEAQGDAPPDPAAAAAAAAAVAAKASDPNAPATDAATAATPAPAVTDAAAAAAAAAASALGADGQPKDPAAAATAAASSDSGPSAATIANAAAQLAASQSEVQKVKALLKEAIKAKEALTDPELIAQKEDEIAKIESDLKDAEELERIDAAISAKIGEDPKKKQEEREKAERAKREEAKKLEDDETKKKSEEAKKMAEDKKQEEQLQVLEQKKKMEKFELEMLKNGAEFTLHSAKGKPQPVTVYLDADRSADLNTQRYVVCWNDPDIGRAMIPGRYVAISDVLDVHSGKETDVFLGKEKASINPSLCLSIVTNDRTIDLECHDQAQRDSWVTALSNMLQKFEETDEVAVAGIDAVDQELLTTLMASVNERSEASIIGSVVGPNAQQSSLSKKAHMNAEQESANALKEQQEMIAKQEQEKKKRFKLRVQKKPKPIVSYVEYMANLQTIMARDEKEKKRKEFQDKIENEKKQLAALEERLFREEEDKKLVGLLKEGQIFQKLTSGGLPHSRFVQLFDEELKWRSPKETAYKEKNSIKVAEIQRIVSGKQSNNFNVVTTGNIEKCFSIVGTNKRSIDLVAPTPEIAAQWIRALKALIDARAETRIDPDIHALELRNKREMIERLEQSALATTTTKTKTTFENVDVADSTDERKRNIVKAIQAIEQERFRRLQEEFDQKVSTLRHDELERDRSRAFCTVMEEQERELRIIEARSAYYTAAVERERTIAEACAAAEELAEAKKIEYQAKCNIFLEHLKGMSALGPSSEEVTKKLEYATQEIERRVAAYELAALKLLANFKERVVGPKLRVPDHVSDRLPMVHPEVVRERLHLLKEETANDLDYLRSRFDEMLAETFASDRTDRNQQALLLKKARDERAGAVLVDQTATQAAAQAKPKRRVIKKPPAELNADVYHPGMRFNQTDRRYGPVLPRAQLVGVRHSSHVIPGAESRS